jgi:hypothetical protein
MGECAMNQELCKDLAGAAAIDWIPYLALIAAIGAWYISFKESRRNNKVIVKLERCTYSGHSSDVAQWDELRVRILNRGIPLHNIAMAIRFRGLGGAGATEVPLRLERRGKQDPSKFSRGMRASFLLTSDDKEARLYLSALEDVRQQEPVLLLFNNSFHARSFPLYSHLEKYKVKWNLVANWKRKWRRVGEGFNGQGVYREYGLPRFPIHSRQLELFLDSIKGESAGSDPPAAQSPFVRERP